MSKYHTLTIQEIKKETPDCSVITFDIPDNLKPEYQFKQGQYLTLKTILNDEEIVRSYSLCTAPYENKWSVAVKKLKGGKFSTYANEKLQSGDSLEVLPPDGKFFVEVTPKIAKNHIAFAAGSGITPVISILKTHLKAEPNSTFNLFYLNKNNNSIIFKKELEQLQKKYPNRLKVNYLYSQENTENALYNGRFTPEKIKQINDEVISFTTVNHAFLCGPQEMIFMIKESLEQLGLDPKNIHFELFEITELPEDSKTIEAVEAEVTIIVDDEELTFTVPKGKSILEIAEAHDADVPFSCKGGVCCTCKAKVIEGSVEMKVNYALDEIDLENNLVLTCQAVPTSKKVVVDYDDVY